MDFYRFVAFRYVSNTRRRWSVLLASMVAVGVALFALISVATMVCFDTGYHGSLTKKVTLALPSGVPWLIAAVGLGLVAVRVGVAYSRLPRPLVALGGMALAGAGVVAYLRPAPPWREIIAVGGAGTGTWTYVEVALASVGALVALLAALLPRRTPGRASVFRGQLFVVLMSMALAAVAALGIVIEGTDPASGTFALLAQLRVTLAAIAAGLGVAGAVVQLAVNKAWHRATAYGALGLLVLVVGTMALGGLSAEASAALAIGVAGMIAAVGLIALGINLATGGRTLAGVGEAALLVVVAAGLLTWGAMARGLPHADVFAAKATGLRFFAEAPTVDAQAVAGLASYGVIALLVAGFLTVFLAVSRLMSFYSTVSIGGVWFGTMALVVVLSVMGGFESDLRDKILGSNAHIQITREHGDFVDWRDVRAKVDATAGVVASTPFAASEVVIASNNNYYNVIIKGIDPTTVARVTDLAKDLDDPTAMQRLDPLEQVDLDLSVDEDSEPIDLSGGGDASANDDAPPAPADAPGARTPPRTPGPGVDVFGGDASTLLQLEGVATLPPPAPSKSAATVRRTQTLHGVLVGRELTRQIHLSTNNEVRLVSPLSDPSNPDATGTPIPFNRDYRVAGVFYTGMYEYDLKYVYVTLASLQSFLDRGDTIDGIEVRVTDPDQTGSVVTRLQRELGPDYRVQDWRELNRNLFSALKLEKIAMFLVLAIIILVASFSIVGNLIMVVIEKGREIALLKTLGASTQGVVAVFVLQGIVIGSLGVGLGIAIGLGICWFLMSYGFPINPDVYYIDKLPVHVDGMSVALVGVAGLAISIAATIYPAILASRLRPAAGLRT
jgi:lipoprotein-releasing system permease protein